MTDRENFEIALQRIVQEPIGMGYGDSLRKIAQEAPASASRSGEAATPELRDLGDEPEGSSSAEVSQPDLSPGVIARVFSAARKHKGYTLRAAEKGSGVPNAHISQIEHGTITRPELSTFTKLCAFYGLNLIDAAETCGYGTEPLIIEVASLRAALVAAEAERAYAIKRFDENAILTFQSVQAKEAAEARVVTLEGASSEFLAEIDSAELDAYGAWFGREMAEAREKFRAVLTTTAEDGS